MTVYEPVANEQALIVAALPVQGRSRHSRRAGFYVQLLLLDIAALLIGPLIATVLLGQMHQLSLGYFPTLAVLAAYLFTSANSGCYSIAALRRASESVRLALSALMPAAMLVVIVAFLVKSSSDISRMSFVLGIAIGATLLVVGRVALQRYALRAMQGRLLDELVIIDERPLAGWTDKHVVVDTRLIGIRADLADPAMLDRFGHLAAGFDRIVIDCVPERRHLWAMMLKGANVDGMVLIDERDRFGAIGIDNSYGRTGLLVSRKPLSMHKRLRKRIFDLALTVPLILLIAPLMILTAIAIKLDSPGPVLFRQDRIGRGNRLFKVLKFRSMRVQGSDNAGTRSTSRDDDRITRVGRFIRSTSIDELPQLLNVLIGDMSLVGPRPHPLGSLAEGRLFWHIDETYWHRHQLKPGITGLAQVRGFRGATLELSDLTNRLQADMEYIQGWGMWRDVSILLNTIRVVVHPNAF